MSDRPELEKLENERHEFTAIVGAFGKKTNFNGYPESTILFKDVKLNNKDICDHVWLTVGKNILKANLKVGDHIKFQARSKPYRKGYCNPRKDIYDEKISYKLNNPTKIETW